jgi:hypothetical protein
MGPDGTIWGREFLSTEPETPREPVIRKRWYSFLLWGRLAFDPDLPDALFRRILASHFPGVPAEKLFDAWAAASRVFPEITRFFWGDIDLKWFPEACLSHPRHRGFYTVRHFVEGETMPGSGNLDIRTWRERVLAGETLDGVPPTRVAEALRTHAATALRLSGELRALGAEGKELRLTLGDIEAMAHLGNYYAEKILGACDLALLDAGGGEERRVSAVGHLEEALRHWTAYAAAYSRQYVPALCNRVGFVDIPRLVEKVRGDIEIARRWSPGSVPRGPGRRGPADVPFRR